MYAVVRYSPAPLPIRLALLSSGMTPRLVGPVGNPRKGSARLRRELRVSRQRPLPTNSKTISHSNLNDDALFYNFRRTYKAHRMSLAMAAGVADRLWNMEDI